MLDDDTKRRLVTRLRRVEGQIGALRRMVEDDAYCVDILLQISAAQGGLGKAGHLLLGHHIETCVSDAFAGDDAVARQDKIDELMDVFARYGGIGGR